MNTRFLIRSLSAVCWLAFALVAAGSARLTAGDLEEVQTDRTDTFDEAISQLAAKVATAIRDENIPSVEVREFNGPSGIRTGLGISELIKARLKQENISTEPGIGAAVIEGKFRVAQHSASGMKCIIVEASLNGALGESIFAGTQYVLTDEKSLITLLPGSGTLPLQPATQVTELEQTRNASLIDQFLSASPAARNASDADTVIRAAEDSKFGIEILINGPGGYTPAPVAIQNGLPFVLLRKDDEYAVRLINDDVQFAAGVTLNIDGINALAFSNPGFQSIGKWVVPAATGSEDQPSHLVRGWHHADGKTFAFKVTDFGAAVVGQSGQPQQNSGIISAAFCVAADDKFPQDEPKLSLKARGDLATGKGALVAQSAKGVFKKFGVTRAVIRIRYAQEHAEDLPSN